MGRGLFFPFTALWILKFIRFLFQLQFCTFIQEKIKILVKIYFISILRKSNIIYTIKIYYICISRKFNIIYSIKVYYISVLRNFQLYNANLQLFGPKGLFRFLIANKNILILTHYEQEPGHFHNFVLISRSTTSKSICCFCFLVYLLKANQETGNVVIQSVPLGTEKEHVTIKLFLKVE